MGIFKNEIFSKLFAAAFASQLGSTVGNMAFAFYLLDRFSNQPSYATIAEMMYSLPILCVFFLVGVAADRFDRKKIAENSDWIRAGLTLGLIGAIYADLLFLTFFILFIRSAVSKFFAPAEMSILQGVLDKEQYMQASGINQAVMGIFMLFGVGLGALSYHYVGILGSITVDLLSFIISGILIRSCNIPLEVRLPNGKTRLKKLNVKFVLSDFAQGFKYIFNFKLLRSIVLGFLVFGLINGGFAVLPLFTMKYKLAPNDYEKYASLFSVFLGIGFIAGSAIANTLIQKIKKHRVIIWGLILTGGFTVLLGMISNPWIYFAIILFMGIVIAPVNVALSGWMTELVDPKFMGRVSGWVDPLMMFAQSLALGLIAVLFPAFFTVDAMYYGIGALMVGVGAYYLLVLPQFVNQQASISPVNAPVAEEA
ncbi:MULTISPECIES: MFS transporter [unclassified Bacillus (in: firmicutes)]|uniref:MFS transporter n=1 Tax=unclassified Bacillus (in: firmicutes) TaxID=185979 RepID=UPI0008EDA2C8|nr:MULTISPECIES: MFS transporter [unclassified Bacillus (in: firmicutes)]SFA86817.1 Major Facilitator Superfamily protein [Bacillus sp. UNCCL13]SFQ83893.1 Major Facilitator Superfamily protein [Bacillus sp. cl95]